MRIALADDIIERTARLALISVDDQPELHTMAQTSLNVCRQRYTQWTAPGLTTPAHGTSCSMLPLPPTRMGVNFHRVVTMGS